MKITDIILIGLIALFAISCDTDDNLAPDKDKYVYDIPQTDLPHDVVTGAYYTNITSSSTWLKSGSKIYAGTPLLGEYLSTSTSVLTQQIKWADEAALNFFIFAWDAASADNTLINNFRTIRAAEGADTRFILNYNTKHLKVTNDAPLQSEEKMALLIDDFVNTLIPSFNDDAYYKVDGKPVVLITPANLSSSALKSIDYSLVIPALKQAVKEAGYDLYLIGEFTTGWVAPVNYETHQIASFDGVTINDWSTNMYDRYYAFFSFIDLNWANWKTSIAQWNTDLIPCVFPSYNDRINSASSYKYTFGQDGVTSDYVNFCNVAKRNIGSKNIVLINSWNNYQKGTNMEPTEENKSQFLIITQQQFKK